MLSTLSSQWQTRPKKEKKSEIGTCGAPSSSVSCWHRKQSDVLHFRVLSAATNADDKTLLFEIVFVIVWLGGAIIAINGQLLGGTISFFQSICLLGYCLFPLNIAALLNLLIGSFVHITVKILYVSIAFIWSSYCKYKSGKTI